MKATRILASASIVVTSFALGWLIFISIPRRYAPSVPQTASASVAAAPVAAPVAQGRKIKAHLYYLAEDGLALTSVERDVAYGETTLAQAREIITAQIAAPSDPLVSAVPPGTKLRALFLTDRGEAFVDLSREVQSAHPGGTANELLTIYTVVNALTINLPAVTAVQLLVDGKEVETLAGHVDLRHPLGKNPAYVQ
jgi:spore germination protein GerM